MPPISRLLPTVLLALTLGACNPRGRECEALRHVVDATPRADAGVSDGDTARNAKTAGDEIDRVEPKTPELATVRGDYRDALTAVAAAAAENDEAVREVARAATPVGEASQGELGALGAIDSLTAPLEALTTPCAAELAAGFGIRAPAGQPARPDCAKVVGIVRVALRPAPGASVAAHAITVAAAAEGASFEDRAMADAAHTMAASLRKAEPALVRIKVPLNDLLKMVGRMKGARARLDEAKAKAAERAGAVTAACLGR